MTHIESLQKQREEAAATGDRLVTGFLSLSDEQRTAAVAAGFWDSVNTNRRIVDSIDQQLAWYNRATGTSWPAQPAWTN